MDEPTEPLEVLESVEELPVDELSVLLESVLDESVLDELSVLLESVLLESVLLVLLESVLLVVLESVLLVPVVLDVVVSLVEMPSAIAGTATAVTPTVAAATTTVATLVRSQPLRMSSMSPPSSSPRVDGEPRHGLA